MGESVYEEFQQIPTAKEMRLKLKRSRIRGYSSKFQLDNTLEVGAPHSGTRFEHWVPLNLYVIELRPSLGFIAYKNKTEFPRLAGVSTRGLKMLGDFLTRILILLLGYAYPGFECYKAVEKNRVEIEELRFWCQYWIIVAIFTVVEKFSDIFISWLPMYGEMKLALIIYMWYPKTKGTGYIYKSILRPVVARHENEIDRKLMEWRARVWDLTIFYWQNCAQLGHSAFFQGLEYLATQSRFSSSAFTKKNEGQNQNAPHWLSKGSSDKETNLTVKNIKRPPSPPPSPGRYINRNMSLTPRGRTVQIRLDSEENNESRSPRTPRPRAQDDLTKDSLNQARARLRRLNTAN